MIATMLEAYGNLRDHTQEALFHTIYGSPLVQALLDLNATDESPRRRPGLEPEERAYVEQKIAELKARIPEGGRREAGIRSILYIGLARRFRRRARLRRHPPPARRARSSLPLAEFKQKLREQFFMLLLDEERAVHALPAMLPEDREQREQVFAIVQEIALAPGEPSEERRRRLARVAGLFGIEAVKPVAASRKRGAAA